MKLSNPHKPDCVAAISVIQKHNRMPMPVDDTPAAKRLREVTMTLDDKLPRCPIYHPLSALQAKSGEFFGFILGTQWNSYEDLISNDP